MFETLQSPLWYNRKHSILSLSCIKNMCQNICINYTSIKDEVRTIYYIWAYFQNLQNYHKKNNIIKPLKNVEPFQCQQISFSEENIYTGKSVSRRESTLLVGLDTSGIICIEVEYNIYFDKSILHEIKCNIILRFLLTFQYLTF